jgi:hypothetical protein
MLKRLAILAIAAFMAVCVSSQPNKAADQKQQPTKQEQPTAVTPNGPNKHASGQKDQPQPKADAPEWYTALERPDWWLVMVAALLIRHETTATLWLSISSKLVWMQQTAGS